MKNLEEPNILNNKNNNKPLDNTMQHASYGTTTKRNRFPKWLRNENEIS